SNRRASEADCRGIADRTVAPSNFTSQRPDRKRMSQLGFQSIARFTAVPILTRSHLRRDCNVFVFILIFGDFDTPAAYHHKVLFRGKKADCPLGARPLPRVIRGTPGPPQPQYRLQNAGGW